MRSVLFGDLMSFRSKSRTCEHLFSCQLGEVVSWKAGTAHVCYSVRELPVLNMCPHYVFLLQIFLLQLGGSSFLFTVLHYTDEMYWYFSFTEVIFNVNSHNCRFLSVSCFNWLLFKCIFGHSSVLLSSLSVSCSVFCLWLRFSMKQDSPYSWWCIYRVCAIIKLAD